MISVLISAYWRLPLSERLGTFCDWEDTQYFSCSKAFFSALCTAQPDGHCLPEEWQQAELADCGAMLDKDPQMSGGNHKRGKLQQLSIRGTAFGEIRQNEGPQGSLPLPRRGRQRRASCFFHALRDMGKIEKERTPGPIRGGESKWHGPSSCSTGSPSRRGGVRSRWIA